MVYKEYMIFLIVIFIVILFIPVQEEPKNVQCIGLHDWTYKEDDTMICCRCGLKPSQIKIDKDEV